MAEASPRDPALLRVGDLAALTGATPRMLRYYENQGLIDAERSPSGQRLFDPAVAAHVRHIRTLLAAGLPTRTISELLDCIHDPERLEPCAVPVLVDHLRDYDARIAELVGTRDTLQGLIDSSAPREDG
ncbi:MAG: MerR family DNA-binding transcriptional regulator [Dermabacter sp.]|nr:MerR family DNA-binding transcriptional regulator [Dermabacter sp.]